MNAIFFKESLRLHVLIFAAIPECGHSLQFIVSCVLSHYPHCILRRTNSGNQISQTLSSHCCLPLLVLLHQQVYMHHINLVCISAFHLVWWLSPHSTSLPFSVSLLHSCALSCCWWGGLEVVGCLADLER